MTAKSGAAKNYLTRSQAVRKLQISLGDFRRLCIFKGIYPREPRSKKRVSTSSTPSTTFYYTKDIHFLLHEPLLAKFREQKALAKKIAKALGRNEVNDAARWERDLAPRMKLDNIIKERYPTFVDALRDLDDALSLLNLFANLPSTADVPARIIAKCQRLTLEFEHYLIRTNSLRKSFLSIKGIYYQATIRGQDILWLVPYRFVQQTAGDIDFRIMATFVEFYASLLGFVNFRLYTAIGLVYPPTLDTKSQEHGAELGAFQLEGREENGRKQIEDTTEPASNERAQAEADRLISSLPAESAESQDQIVVANDNENEDPEATNGESTALLDHFTPIDSSADALTQPSLSADASIASHLFEPFTLFLSRETPRHPLEFLLKAFGCKRVGFDSLDGEVGSYCTEDDPRITHQVVDRPDLPLPSPPLTDGEIEADEGVIPKIKTRVPGRIYVQPQWVWDCINNGRLMRSDEYAPGATLPPHLSPWVKPKKGEYDPTVSLEEQETLAEQGAEERDEVADGQGIGAPAAVNAFEAPPLEVELEQDGGDEDGGMDVELAASDDDSEAEEDDFEPVRSAQDDGWAGLSEDGEDDNEDTQYQAELNAEALGRQVREHRPVGPKTQAANEAAQKERAEQEDIERRKMLMPRRKRKVYEKMVYSNARKDEEAEKLRAKRRKIEKGR